MDWIRSFPAGLGTASAWPGRTFVSDGLIPISYMDRDYRPVLDRLTADTVIVEWDIAISCEDRARFQRFCEAQPGRVSVAPYRLYPMSTGLRSAVWAHRRVEAHDRARWVRSGEATCDWFGLGMTYLPLAVVRQALADLDGPVNDTNLSQWHQRAGYGPVPIAWMCRPIHLHYSADDARAHYAALAACNSPG